MEYVEGRQIDRNCNVYKLTFTERLKLSRGVCAAVQYANQKLVVHGGLKVRNIIGTTGGVASRPWRWRALICAQHQPQNAGGSEPELRADAEEREARLARQCETG